MSNIFEEILNEQTSKKKETMSFMAYLDLCKKDKMTYASAAERMLHAIGEPQVMDTSKEPRLSRIFLNRTVRVYPAFSDFYGMEETIERIVGYFRHAAQGLEERKQVLYLMGPKVVRKMRLFKLVNDSRASSYMIGAIQNQEGFKDIRSTLARGYEMDDWFPKIEITSADIRGDRTLTMTYYREQARNLDENWHTMISHVHRLWGHRVKLVTGRGHVIGECV